MLNVHQISETDQLIENEFTARSKDKFHFLRTTANLDNLRQKRKLCQHDRGQVFNGVVWRCKECGKSMENS